MDGTFVIVDKVLAIVDMRTTSDVVMVVLVSDLDIEAVEAADAVETVKAVEAVETVGATLALEDIAVCEIAESDKDEELEQERSYNGMVFRVVPTTPKLGLGVVG